MMFLKLLSWKKACIFEEASIFEGILEVEDLDESLDLQSSKMFLKLESWKKVCIFKGALIFEGGRLQELRRFLSLGRILSRPSRAKNFQLFQLKRTPLFIEFLSGTAVSDPTSIGGQSGFCRQIHRPSRSDQAPSSFGEVVVPSAIQLLSGDDRAFVVRSTALIGAIGHLRRLERWYCRQRSNFYWGMIGLLPSDRAPSSFGEVVLLSAIQLLSRDDRAFVVRSTALVGAIGDLRRFERWYCRQRSNFYRETIGLLPSDPPSWSDRAPSSFGEVVLPSAIRLLSGDDRAFAIRSTALVKAIKYVHRLERWGQNCTIDVFLEKQRWSYTVVVLLMLQHIRNEVELFIYLFYFFCADISFRGGRAASTSMKPKVRVQRGADRREAGRMREGHMDVSGFLIASADVFC
ncbi:hypothetical protein E5676_scaffold156G00970 [Cucumis melo var. makuwa]|uniref:Uncharacterized protein n=1 Tax=Cucumis melo var. makuwa TaxID=1194695 RepID=A0A5D3BKR7_CUCMM|nr:hypothetical protein E5676_scaffold156G00970 [Cucumis melo var. makuwa]